MDVYERFRQLVKEKEKKQQPQSLEPVLNNVTGVYNVAVGYQALNTTGKENVAVGAQAIRTDHIGVADEERKK